MDLREVATNIYQGEQGIWMSPTRSSISYPEDGNEIFMGIEGESFWFRHRNQCLIELLKRFPPNGPFFDIGGGNGFVSLGLQNAGWPVVLVEPGTSGAINAQRRGVAEVVCSSLEDAGFREGSMAAAGAFDVVEHIPDDHQFVASVSRALAPEGRLYVTVPAFPWLWSQEDNDAGHYRRYTASALRRLLEAEGLKVEYLTYFFQLLPLPIFLLRTLPYALGVRRSATEVRRRAASEHKAPPAAGRALNALLNRELAMIRSGRELAFGGSCLCVARKTPSK